MTDGSKKMREALEALLERYVGLVKSGDAGFWDPEEEKEVINAREALSSPPVVGDGKNEEIAHGIVYMHHSHSKIKDLPCLENDIKEALDQKDAEKVAIQREVEEYKRLYEDKFGLMHRSLREQNESLQSKLSLAVEALERISEDGFNRHSREGSIAIETLAKVKEK